MSDTPLDPSYTPQDQVMYPAALSSDNATPEMVLYPLVEPAEVAALADVPVDLEQDALPVTSDASDASEPEIKYTEKHVFALGDVNPGDTGGFANIVVRMLGMGDSGIYSDNAVTAIKTLQKEAGLEETGIVTGETWGLVLPMAGANASGEMSAILRGLIGLSPTGRIDHEVSRILVHNLGSDWNGLVTSAEWRKLLTMEITIPEPETSDSQVQPVESVPA